jgi:hypothetical protein
VATCAQQGRSLYRFLAEAVQAHFPGSPAPSLLPRPFGSVGTYQVKIVFQDAGGRTGEAVWTVNVAAHSSPSASRVSPGTPINLMSCAVSTPG